MIYEFYKGKYVILMFSRGIYEIPPIVKNGSLGMFCSEVQVRYTKLILVDLYGNEGTSEIRSFGKISSIRGTRAA